MLGIAVDNKGTKLNIRARKAVIIATGGSTGNVNFRRMFDPRLTEEYCGLAGMPWSDQDASGELAAMAIGASLWGLYNQTGEFGSNVTKPGTIGCQYGYANLQWLPGSAVFDRARATGLRVADWQDVILVNMLGKRFYDETGEQFTANNYKIDRPLRPGQLSQRQEHQVQAQQLPQRRAGRHRRRAQRRRPDLGDLRRRRGRRARNGTRRRRTSISTPASSSAPTRSRELAAKIVMKYQRVPMPPDEPGSDRRALQLLRRFRRRRGLRQAQAARTRSPSRPSTPPGRRRSSTTRAPACASTPSARWWT